MDSNEISKLEKKFDKHLTEGEAAEIKNTKVLHTDDEDYYESEETIPSVPAIVLTARGSGSSMT